MLSLLLLLISVTATFQACSRDSCNQWSSKKDEIQVHLIPHTHDDLGWIKTVDQYFYGSKPALVPVGVQYIYNTVIDELEKHPDRRFSFAETGFLWRWYTSNNDFERHRLVKLVKNGQIELIGGGWVQNDEAASHYVDIIDQMTLGLRKLEQLFGECGKPDVAWQIDPFGHSREMANLFALMGYNSLFFARMHYQEKEIRLQNKSLEFIWNSSDELKTQILTGGFYQDNYGPPEGFCWDALCGDDPIMDNSDLEDYNVDEKVAAFVKHVKKQASYQRTNHVMLLMGSDFQYTNANPWYLNLDKLIKYVNANSSLGVNVFYSTPSCYVKAINQVQPRLSVKDDDFFPYASSNHSFWTGYFTSRPAFKGMIRDASSLLQLAKQLDALGNLGPSDDSDVEKMEKASALAQHHDAVTGTAKENVTKDYEKRLSVAMAEGEIVVADYLKKVYPKDSTITVLPQSFCPLINETVCEPIHDATVFSVIVFNPLATELNRSIMIPYYSKQAQVTNPKGETVPSQLLKTFQVPMQLSLHERAPYQLWFDAIVPPLGYTTYIVNSNPTTYPATVVLHPYRKKAHTRPKRDTTPTIENEYLTLNFDSAGLLQSVTDKATGETKKFKQQFFWYKGVDGNSSQPSGAYIFRPDGEKATFTDPIKYEITKSEIASEFRQIISPWVAQTIRLIGRRKEIEFEWVVGPIPKEVINYTRTSKEIVTSYETDIASNGVFYTDANGRQMMKRKVYEHPSFKYENTEPVAANYYPITNRVLIKDSKNQMTILTDRSAGATSTNGRIEIMLHRRCFYDDHWGVEEALDEPGYDGKGLVAKGTHTVVFGAPTAAASTHRPLAVEIFHRPILTFSPIKDATQYRQSYNMQLAGLRRSLPSFIHLLSLQKWHKKSLLLRLEHIYQNEEDTVNSVPQKVDLKDLFTGFDITSVNVLMLAANRNETTSHVRSEQLVFELKPMEIKTLQLEVNWK